MRFTRLLPLLGAALCCAGIATSQVAPTTIFQLNGDASGDNLTCTYGTSSGTCDYWNLLNGTGVGNPPGAPGHSLVRTFVNGTSSTQSFTGGDPRMQTFSRSGLTAAVPR